MHKVKMLNLPPSKAPEPLRNCHFTGELLEKAVQTREDLINGGCADIRPTDSGQYICRALHGEQCPLIKSLPGQYELAQGPLKQSPPK